MTYSTNGLIEAADYNAIINSNSPNFNQFWATGTGDSGYGQTSQSTVFQNARVNASNWNSLITRMASTASHQGSTITAVTPPTADTRIDVISALSSNMSILNTNRLNAAASGTDITSTGTRTAPWGSGQGIPTVTAEATITWASANAARFFFNAGGTVRISASLTGAGGTPENTAWVNLCNDIGTLALPAVSTAQTIAGTSYTGFTKLGGGGSAPTQYLREGYYTAQSLPWFNRTFFEQYSNFSVYTNDYIRLRIDGDPANQSFIKLKLAFVDSASFFANTITGALAVTCTARPPSTANLANSWGTPTVSVTAPA
jgi:hypothetical protein